jgi:hypothetical protein
MDAPLASGRFVFGERLIFIPPPPYPPGAALFEHQRAQLGGCGVLQPERMDHGGCKMLPADEAVPVLTDHAARELPASTAYKVWPAAYDLAHRLSVLNIAGKSVLELGAGCGLPGLAAWCVGARRVLLTDVAENIPRLSQLIEQNGASSAVAVAELDWTQRALLLSHRLLSGYACPLRAWPLPSTPHMCNPPLLSRAGHHRFRRLGPRRRRGLRFLARAMAPTFEHARRHHKRTAPSHTTAASPAHHSRPARPSASVLRRHTCSWLGVGAHR